MKLPIGTQPMEMIFLPEDSFRVQEGFDYNQIIQKVIEKENRNAA